MPQNIVCLLMIWEDLSKTMPDLLAEDSVQIMLNCFTAGTYDWIPAILQ
jgi:hypothetical protein